MVERLLVITGQYHMITGQYHAMVNLLDRVVGQITEEFVFKAMWESTIMGPGERQWWPV